MSERNHILLRVEGMTCEGCARHVAEALRSVPGVEQAQVGSWLSAFWASSFERIGRAGETG
ncbi:MAG: heavy-metal-associated domain-containing protein [Nitrospirae bacterium]|nr:heavy-metal-associated domain-containing protein [Nitrospirota bacterium]